MTIFKIVCNCLLITALSTNVVKAQKASDEDSLYCLKLYGKVSDPETDKLPDCYVELFDGLDLVDSLCLKEETKKFSFFLKRDRSYALRISMKGYVSQLVSVNTEFPADIEDVVPFSFNTILVSETKARTLNRDAMDFPIAIVFFDRTKEEFVHNENYTADIKKQIGIPYKVTPAETLHYKPSKGKKNNAVILPVTY